MEWTKAVNRLKSPGRRLQDASQIRWTKRGEVGSTEIRRYRPEQSREGKGGFVAQVKPSQRQALDSLARADAPDLTRARYQELTGVSRSQAAYDLAELVEAGLLVRIGGGRATRYRLAQAGDSGRRRWTDERIRTELAGFCANRTTWPSAAEFKAAGRSDLYVAASRYGGIRFWAAELGFPRAERRRPTTPLFPRRVALAVAAVVVFALGAGVAALALRVHRHSVAAPAAPKTQSRSQSPAPVSYLVDLRALRRARVAGFAAERAATSTEVSVVLRASRGDSWISVRSAAGRLLDERLLAAGSRLRLRGTTLSIRLGAAGNVDLATNGSRPHALPARAAVVVVTRRGMRVAEWTPPPTTAPVLVASRSPAAPPPPAAPAPLPKPAKPAPPPPPPPAAQASKRSQAGWPSPLPSP
jgi:hypothetical protein